MVQCWVYETMRTVRQREGPNHSFQSEEALLLAALFANAATRELLPRTKYSANRFLDRGTHIAIELYDSQGRIRDYALVDRSALSLVRGYKWHLACRRNTNYAETIKRGKRSLLHSLVLGAKPGFEI